MADDTRSPRDIERELEQERAELRSTVDQLMGRLTFEDAWERTGKYLRENRSEYGHTLGRMAREKPVALAITAIGIGWLLFGPATPAPRGRERGAAHPQRLPEADRDPYSTQPRPRTEPAERLPRASEVSEAQRTSSPAGAGSVSGTSAAATHPAPSSATSGSSGSARSTSAGSAGTGTSTPSPAATPTSRTGPTSTEGDAARNRPSGAPPTGSGATSTSPSPGAGPAGSQNVRDTAATSSKPTSSAADVRPPGGTGSPDREKDEDRST